MEDPLYMMNLILKRTKLNTRLKTVIPILRVDQYLKFQGHLKDNQGRYTLLWDTIEFVVY